MERELRDLPPKDAYCLAALPAIYQVGAAAVRPVLHCTCCKCSCERRRGGHVCSCKQPSLALKVLSCDRQAKPCASSLCRGLCSPKRGRAMC